MSSPISTSLSDSTSLSGRAVTRNKGESEEGGQGFDKLVKSGDDRKTVDRKGEGTDEERSEQTEDGTAQKLGSVENVTVEDQKASGAMRGGRLGFEWALRETATGSMTEAPKGTATPEPSKPDRQAGAALEVRTRATIEQLLETANEKSKSGAAMAETFLNAEKLGGTGKAESNRPDLMPAPSKFGQARADLVSMRTDFQPRGMDETGAKAAAASSLLPGRRFDVALKGTEQAQAGKDAIESSKADTDLDALLSASRAKPSAGDRNAELLPARASEKSRAEPAVPVKTVEKTIDANASFGKEIGTVLAGSLTGSESQQGPSTRASDQAHSAYQSSGERVRYQAGGAAMKSLQIQLQPAHFGKLDVLMKVVGGQMMLDLAVSEPETLMRLQDDREGLKSVMAAAGFDLDEANVTITLRENGAQGRLPGAQADRADDSRPDANAGNGNNFGQSRDEAGERGGQGSQGGPSHASGQAGARGPSNPGLERGHREGSQLYL